MKKCKSIIGLSIICFLLILSLTGCKLLISLSWVHMQLNSPPNANAVEELYIDNKEDIHTVVLFLENLKYQDIYIDTFDGEMLADMTQLAINDYEVVSAIKCLFENNMFKSISKHGNTISLSHWSGLQDIGCGIAYSINGVDRPEVQFMTELVPLTEDGWFYYVDDYNKWRSGERADQ